MRKSLSLSAYLTLRKTDSAGIAAEWPKRPKGPLVWIHCTASERVSSVAAIAQQLQAQGDELTILCTTSAKVEGPADGVIYARPPAETLGATGAFLGHWEPDVLLWLSGDLRPALLAMADDHPMHKLVVDVTETQPDLRQGARFPGLTRACLNVFDTAICADRAGVLRLERAGLPASRIQQFGHFDPLPALLPCVESEREEFATLLASRPIWLAAEVPTNEITPLLTAYKIASQLAHRLFLILSCQDPLAAEGLLEGTGYAVRTFASGAMPNDGTQIYLTDTEDMGLWYRLAPLTYIGGTLHGGQTCDPFAAAALGSVVVHGMKTSHHQHRFEQLADASACRLVETEGDLGRVIEALLAPDKAAVMAHAAWDVTSQGAETTSVVMNIIRREVGLEVEGAE